MCIFARFNYGVEIQLPAGHFRKRNTVIRYDQFRFVS